MVCSVASAQETGRIRLQEDWGIGDPGELRFGQLSLLSEEDGARLVPYQLLSGEAANAARSGDQPRSSRVPETSEGVFVLSSFAGGNQNSLGGYFSSFYRAPASGSARLGEAPDGTTALQVTCEVEPGTWCGVWIHLFETTAAPSDRVFLDADPFEFLTFGIRTSDPDAQIRLRVADADWEEREDAPLLGTVGEFADSRYHSGGWSQIEVSVDALPFGVDRHELASLVFEVASPGRTRFWIRNAVFRTGDSGEVDFGGDDARVVSPERHRAAWAWFTDDWLREPALAEEAIGFLRTSGVDTLFLQLPDTPGADLGPGERTLETARLAPLLRHLFRAGIRTYALDGAPEYAREEFRPGILRTVSHVVAYNRAVDPESRFYGIRYDIEPYLLAGFHGPRQEEILATYLTLIQQVTLAAHAGGLVVGADFPFWYDVRDSRTGETVDVEWNGIRKPVSDHLIDLVDDVAIMAYRTMGYGPDGTIRHSIDEVRYATRRGKEVFIGLETGYLPEETLIEFEGEPQRGLPASPSLSPRVYLIGEATERRFVYAPPGVGVPQVPSDPTAVLWWPVSRTLDVPSSKLTFRGMSMRDLDEVRRDTRVELGTYSAFAGFAIHHLDSWRELRPIP
jgi:hypothetical protein